MADSEELLFKGLKVLDVGTWIAGPVAGTMLADFGADVIKVETPGIGDPYRMMTSSPLSPRADYNYPWVLDARNKRGITLNLKTEAGRDILMRLVRECDVYITNQPTPTRERFGLTYEQLAPINPRMIYASLSAYGETGPDAGREGFDAVTWWARSGLMDLVRAQGAPPGGSTPGMGDHPTAVTMYAMIVTALMRRERTGKGSHVHTSLLHNGIWSNACHAQAAFSGADLSPLKAERGASPNRNPFPTRDGRLLWLYMVRTQEELDALFVAAGRPDLLADERFSEPTVRMAHLAELVEVLGALFLERDAADWMAAFRSHNVPVVLIAEVGDLPDDPQVKAAGIISRPSDPGVPAEWVINNPMNIDGMPRRGTGHAPAVGEHTAEVLAELGFDAAAIASLRDQGAI